MPTIGPIAARLLVVGLAPGRSGANRTGIPFVGDASGDWLFEALETHGVADGVTAAVSTRGAEASVPHLGCCRITNAVRCLPPQNRPTGVERQSCLDYLERDLGLLCRGGRRRAPVAVLALGRFAHDAVLKALRRPGRAAPFAHGALHGLAPNVTLADSYHCSRYNTQTGRLTRPMFHRVLRRLRELLDAGLECGSAREDRY